MNKYEMRTCGIRRSGNYAIIYWLMAHFPKGVYNSFNLVPGQNPVIDGEMIFTIDNHSQMISFDRNAEKDIFFSYESIDLTKVQGNLGSLIPDKVQAIGKSEKEFDLLILRDPFNLMASICQYRFRCKHLAKDIYCGIKINGLRLWKMYAEEALDRTNYFNEKIVVLFNKWFTSKTYRRELCSKLGLRFTDKDIDFVSGKGSSFDRTSYQGKGHEMKVLERWKHFADVPQFKACFEDKEIWNMSDEIFGRIPGTEILKEKK